MIATKVGSSPELPGLSQATVRKGAEASLARLGIDRIDLYYAHKDDPETPLEQTLQAFGALIDDGMIRHAAASNYSAQRLDEALRIGERDGMASYVALQPHYNLMEREHYERELAPLCERHGLACIPYFALAQGFLTGKYRPTASRSTARARRACASATSTSAASRFSTRSTRSPPSTRRRSRRWRWPGCAHSRRCSRRSPARPRRSSSAS